MTKSLTKANKQQLNYYIEKYLQNRPLFFSFIRPQEALFFHQNISKLKSPILDYGCGDGFFTSLIFSNKTIDIGLDLKNSRINQSKKYGVYRKLVTYDGKTIPFKDNYFGSVISNCVLEHLPNLRKKLTEVYRVIKPGGYFLNSVMTDKWENQLLGGKLFGQSYLDYFRKKQVHINLLTNTGWNNIFTNTGFQIEASIGYFGSSVAKYSELAHYIASPSIISHRIFHRWILYPSWYKHINLHKRINKTINEDFTGDNRKYSAIFYILKKPS